MLFCLTTIKHKKCKELMFSILVRKSVKINSRHNVYFVGLPTNLAFFIAEFKLNYNYLSNFLQNLL